MRRNKRHMGIADVSVSFRVLLVLLAVSLVSLLSAGFASAAEPWWHLTSIAIPSNMTPGGEGVIWVEAVNAGDATINMPVTPITLSDALPAGLTATAIRGFTGGAEGSHYLSEGECALATLTCVYDAAHVYSGLEEEPARAILLAPYRSAAMEIKVKVGSSATGGQNTISVDGGGALPAKAQHPVNVSDTPAPYGIENYEFTPQEDGGALDYQAGSHPFQVTATLAVNKTTAIDPETNTLLVAPVALSKDLQFVLPEGMFGNPTPIPQCTSQQFATKIGGSEATHLNECPTDSVVGVASVTVREAIAADSPIRYTVPLFNLTPSVGEPARFGFVVEEVPVILDTAVRTGGGYNVLVNVNNISQIVSFIGSEVTFWGVPGDQRHNNVRNWWCIEESTHYGSCVAEHELHPPPLLTLPTSCTGPLKTTLSTDSWAEPGKFTDTVEPLLEQGMDGCNRLDFEPSIQVAPDGKAASTPTGLSVDVHVPQTASLNANGDAESTVRNTTVTLPAGVSLNPSGADGLQACGLGEIGLADAEEQSCPEAAKVGTVEIRTPLLPNPLVGSAYLAQQDANPFGSLVALYIVARDPVSGVLIKLAGQVTPDPQDGQLVSTFDNTPQLPFEDLTLHFFGGSRAPLGTPAYCGGYKTTASIAPWSATSPVESSSEFQITSGPNGTPCSSSLPFNPSLTTGSLNLQAGAFTPFTMTMSREDGNQNLDAIQLKMPPGLLGTLSSVKLCGEAQANAGTCGPESLIGHTTVSVGLGGNPYTVTGGEVFITGPYKGAPYGLSIVNPAKAGPFNLGYVIVRAKIEVNPENAALTITSDSTGPYTIPQIIDGIPLQIKHVNVSVDRPGFTFNPTNCNPQEIGGSLTSSQGAIANLHVPFQVTNCAILAFKPVFTVSTNGKTSRKSGASLNVKLTYPKAPFGTQANIGKVKVDLPKQLPSRLSTLQKACPDSTFDANPSACPPDSRIGSATATTPVLPVHLEGPAYFVSHAGLKFPELIVALSGEGVTVYLHGETFISPQGITSSTFRTIPDVPIGVFELKLPQGPDSALAANTNLCTTKLVMPTIFVAANGASIKQSTPITTTGCSKKKTVKKKTKPHRHKKKK